MERPPDPTPAADTLTERLPCSRQHTLCRATGLTWANCSSNCGRLTYHPCVVEENPAARRPGSHWGSWDSNTGRANPGPTHTGPSPIILQWAVRQNANLRTRKPEAVSLPVSRCKVWSSPATSLGLSPRVHVGRTRSAPLTAQENSQGQARCWASVLCRPQHSVSPGPYTSCTSRRLRGCPSSTYILPGTGSSLLLLAARYIMVRKFFLLQSPQGVTCL